jgi:hypothetical protein
MVRGSRAESPRASSGAQARARYHADVATARIRIDQPAHPSQPVGQAGKPRRDLVLGQPVVVRNVDDTDVSRWLWSILDRPIGSTVVLASVSSPQAIFTPDVDGSYRIQLQVNDGLLEERQILVAAIENSLGHRLPAAGEQANETNFPGIPPDDGWSKDVERILRAWPGPQYLSAAAKESIASGSASELFAFGGLGLPQGAGEITGADFIDIDASAVGDPPTVNGYAFADIPGESALASVCVVTVDLDTTGCTAGDQWAMILLTTTRGNLLVANLNIT